jgi:DNA-binding NtrC family response regulator
MTRLSGHAAIDELRLSDAEILLRTALLSAEGCGDEEEQGEARLALARCLFWRGRYHEAASLTDARADEGRRPDWRVRARIERSRAAVGEGDLVQAVKAATEALALAESTAEGLVGDAALALAFAHLSVGDYLAVEHDVALAMARARADREPLLLVRAHLIGAEAARRRGRGGLATRLATRLQGIRVLPPLLAARASLLGELARAESEAEVIERRVKSTGAEALRLFAQAAPTGAGRPAADLVGVLELCQRADEEETILAAICDRLRHRLDARGVVFVIRHGERWERLAGDGGRVDATFATRVEALAATIAPHAVDGVVQSGAPVRYGGRAVAVLLVRWGSGVGPLPPSFAELVTTAAVAAAPACAAAVARLTRVTGHASELLGMSSAMDEVRDSISRAAAAPFPVLIEGESGSGKELVARAIHRASLRRDRSFCALNCAALPDDLVESELFGHVRGAFTGANTDRTGVFEAAHLGTVFLDEIGELSARAQAKVLRTVQEGEVRRVGETTARHVDVRLLAATNRDLRQEAAEGRFRVDLLYRLDVIRITVPPLRERTEDIAVLAEHFWREAAAKTGSRAVLATATLAALTRYHWPGNVRELQNVLYALAARSPRRGVVEPRALPPVFETVQATPSWRLDAARRVFEAQFVRAALTRTGGDRSQAASELGVTRQGLAKLITRLGLDNRDGAIV